MNVLSFFKDKEWIPLYFKELANRLRRDKNLSDLKDKTEALQNLGLDGTVETHNHDTLYPRKDDIEKALANNKKVLEDSIRETNGRVDTIVNDNLAGLSEKIDTKLDKNMIYVGTNEPAASEGMLWFCIKNGEVSIRAYSGNKWYTAGAVWQ